KKFLWFVFIFFFFFYKSNKKKFFCLFFCFIGFFSVGWDLCCDRGWLVWVFGVVGIVLRVLFVFFFWGGLGMPPPGVFYASSTLTRSAASALRAAFSTCSH
ncbi:hypothetical protein, partial [Enterobacter intestinihominis]